MPNPPFRLALGFTWQFGLVAAFFPMLPIYLDDLGVSASNIALLISIHALTAFFTVQFYGYLADTVFRRTTLLLLMNMGSSLVAAMFPFLPPKIGWLALGMVGMSLFFSQRIALYNALVLDSRKGEELFGRLRFVGSLSFAVFAPILGFLADSPAFTPAVMWIAMVCFELMFAIALTLLHDEAPRDRGGQGVERLTFRKAQKILLANPLLVRFLVFIFLFQWMTAPAHILQIKMLKDIGSASVFATSCLAFAALCEMFIFLFGNQLLRKIRLMPLMAMIPAASALRAFMVFAVPTPAVIFASNALHMFTFGLAYLCSVIFIHRESPRELKSSAQSIFGLVFSIIAVFAGNTASYLWMEFLSSDWGPGLSDQESLRVMYGTFACLVLISFFAWFPMRRAYEAKHRVRGFWVRD